MPHPGLTLFLEPVLASMTPLVPGFPPTPLGTLKAKDPMIPLQCRRRAQCQPGLRRLLVPTARVPFQALTPAARGLLNRLPHHSPGELSQAQIPDHMLPPRPASRGSCIPTGRLVQRPQQG